MLASIQMQEAERTCRILAIFCNPKGTDALRLQSEQRVLQQALRSARATLEVVPAATIDDLRTALCGKKYDVIHFSGHGCIDGPLQALVRNKLAGSSDGLLRSPQLLPRCTAALKQWLQTSGLHTNEGCGSDELCTLVIRPTPIEGGDPEICVDLQQPTPSESPPAASGPASGDVCLSIRGADLIRHRVGALAFEGPTGALEPPKPDVLARLLAGGLDSRHGVVFLNACDTHIQARWLREQGCQSVVYAGSRISDQAASEFSRGFYEALACGCATAECFAQGQLAVELRLDPTAHGCPKLLHSTAMPGGGDGLRCSNAHAHASPSGNLAGCSGSSAVGASAAALQPLPPPEVAVSAAATVGLLQVGFGSVPLASTPAVVLSSAGTTGGSHNLQQASTFADTLLEEFSGETVSGCAPPLRELVPMPGASGSRQLMVCETSARLVRDRLGRLHALSSSQMATCERSDDLDRLSAAQRQLMTLAQRHATLLGAAQKLRWGVLQQLEDGQLREARAQLLHALQLIRAVAETVPAPPAAQQQPSPIIAEAGASSHNATAGAIVAEAMATAAAAGCSAAAVESVSGGAVGATEGGATAVYVYPQVSVALGEADSAKLTIL